MFFHSLAARMWRRAFPTLSVIDCEGNVIEMPPSSAEG